MKFDIFLAICQTEVDGYIPSEKQMYKNFFDQLVLADELGFGTAWVAETHLSTEVQKGHKQPVVPHFRGEIGLNTDILQLAHLMFNKTKKINVGSAICNILCNGGPIAHAEALKTFLTLHEFRQQESGGPLDKLGDRRLNYGFASGRFEFSNRPYGIRPRSLLEEAAWPVMKGEILKQATEIFLRFLKGDIFSSNEVKPMQLKASAFRQAEDWAKVKRIWLDNPAHREGGSLDSIELSPFWEFEKTGVIPFEAPLDALDLTLGTHDEELQRAANEILPVGVFNLSITPPAKIEATHARMSQVYHADGGPWRRDLMPRTTQVFLCGDQNLSSKEQSKRAKAAAEMAWENYWKAMTGTIDKGKVEGAVTNSLWGCPEEVVDQIKSKYDANDRLMLWFDFNIHDNEEIKKRMRVFTEKVLPNI